LSDGAGEAVRAASSAGVADLSNWVLLRVEGADRVSYLHRILSCAVKDVPAGGGVRGLLLTAKGKVVADVDLSVLPEVVLGHAPPAARPGLVDGLRRFVISDDCEPTDRSGVEGLLAVVGPRAAEVLERVLGTTVPALAPEGSARTTAAGREIVLFRRDRFGLPGYRMQADFATVAALHGDLLREAEAIGGGALSVDGLDVLRVEAREPALGREFGEDTLPQEAGLEDRISFTKGCFLGQEPVARLQNRGRTQRGLVSLDLGKLDVLPVLGAPLSVDGHEVGVLGTAVHSTRFQTTLALALLRHEYAAPGTTVEVGGNASDGSSPNLIRATVR
jgi:folate-binding protein YgfZ